MATLVPGTEARTRSAGTWVLAMIAGVLIRARLVDQEALARLRLPVRKVRIAGRQTGVRLERVMWEALQDIACQNGRSVDDLVTEIERERTIPDLTIAIRSYIIGYYRAQIARGSLKYAEAGRGD